MAKKNISWKTKGMNRDTSVSAFNPEFAFENMNLRLSTNEGNTMMSWVNEKGTKRMSLHIAVKPWLSDTGYNNSILGTPIGTAVINHKLVIFTTDTSLKQDYITVLKASDGDYDFTGKILFRDGSLGFDVGHPLETLVSYESENIQKVYWTDNLNQPRVINIADCMDSKIKDYNFYSFDFTPKLELKEEVTVIKTYGAGEFPAGVIQYAFTYYNKYMQESNIFYTTPLQYITYADRGGSPDSKIANCFKITVTGVDQSFEYMRIYSILRTSKDATPLVKRIQDIEINSTTITHIDNGIEGDTVDPTELLYLGGEEVVVKTMEQKDSTLFLGNIIQKRPNLREDDNIETALLGSASIDSPCNNGSISAVATTRYYNTTYKGDSFKYINTLDSSSSTSTKAYTGAACFKSREYYRLGVQFQYMNGKWSEPFWIGDKQCDATPFMDKEGNGTLNVPEFTYTMPNIFSTLYSKGYRKVRPVFAVPGSQDKTILCQGIGAPTMYRNADKHSGLHMASWLFRTPIPKGSSDDWNVLPAGSEASENYNGGGYITSSGTLESQFDSSVFYGATTSDTPRVVSPFLSSTEIMGKYDTDNIFHIDKDTITINSPDVEFDDALTTFDFDKCFLRTVGYTEFTKTYGDINIQTSTPAIGSDAGGFTHRSIVTAGSAALISGLFYNDYIVDDDDSTPKYAAYHTSSPAVDFPVFMWHKNGSLNNDVSRDNRSAELLKKKISNYRLGDKTTYDLNNTSGLTTYDIQLFYSDVLSMVKVNGNVYQGNVDTMVTPSEPSPFYFAGSPWRSKVDTNYGSRCYYRLALKDPSDTTSRSGVWTLRRGNVSDSKFGQWGWYCSTGTEQNIGDYVKGLDQWREGVSIKYKSTPHLVANISANSGKGVYAWGTSGTLNNGCAPIMEVCKKYNKDTMFGGTSDEAFQAATWIPCGPPKSFNSSTTSMTLEFKWGDSYLQRVECLKTYPYTTDDKNQVIEIASFVVETRVNMDGRYDRNRAQTSNLNMTPLNFNLINPVYSQMDNFFSYKILSEDYYKNTSFPNNITWTKTKESGADIDQWTNVTLASTLEMDGNKGEVNKIVRLNDQLIAFQDSGIAQILYNENTQISTTEGVPIEIANSGKVQGKRYYSDTIGCSNKWSIVTTPSGIYFMDSNDKSIYLFNGQLNNLTTAGGFNSWAKENIAPADKQWTPSSFGATVAYYDKLNQDVLFINSDKALAYSEKFNCFTSFYDYGGIPYFNNLDDMGLWIGNDHKVWRHQAGDYCNFFGENKPFSMTLIANQEPQLDKVFTNLEFRACVEGEGTYDTVKDKFSPSLPFDTLEVWDEYQHGILNLSDRNGHDRFTHGNADGNASLNRKFRIWRCDIPRDNATVDATTESILGIKRFKARPLDRIRNPWAYMKLSKSAATTGVLSKVEVHDIVATYFG